MSLVRMKNKDGAVLRCEPKDVDKYKAQGYKPADPAAAGGPGGGDDDSKKEPAKGGEADASKAADKGG